MSTGSGNRGRDIVPQLETGRLRLRSWRMDDVGPYAGMLLDPEVVGLLGCGQFYRLKLNLRSVIAKFSDVETRLGIRALQRHWRLHGFGEWAVEEKASRELIGRIGLTSHPDFIFDRARTEVGWLLARRAWSRGFAIEGAIASLEFAFDHLQMERIISITKYNNVRSLSVMKRLGLRRSGSAKWKGCKVVWYAIDRDSWNRDAVRERAGISGLQTSGERS